MSENFFFTFNCGIKISLIKIFNPGVPFVNPVAGFLSCYPTLRIRAGDITHFQIVPEGIDVAFLASDDKLQVCLRILQREMWSKASFRLSDINPPLFLGNPNCPDPFLGTLTCRHFSTYTVGLRFCPLYTLHKCLFLHVSFHLALYEMSFLMCFSKGYIITES